MRKRISRTMKPSEESIPLITSYRLPRHRSRFFRTLLSYSLQIYACKKDSHLCKSFSFISSFLSRLCVAVSLSFARPFAPSKDVLRLSRATRPDRKFPMQKSTQISLSASFFISSFLSSLCMSNHYLLRAKAVVWHPGSPARIGSFPCKKTPDELGVFPLSAASYPPGPLPAKYFRRL